MTMQPEEHISAAYLFRRGWGPVPRRATGQAQAPVPAVQVALAGPEVPAPEAARQADSACVFLSLTRIFPAKVRGGFAPGQCLNKHAEHFRISSKGGSTLKSTASNGRTAKRFRRRAKKRKMIFRAGLYRSVRPAAASSGASRTIPLVCLSNIRTSSAAICAAAAEGTRPPSRMLEMQLRRESGKPGTGPQVR